MRELIKHILREEVQLNEFRVNRSSLIHDLNMMDFDPEEVKEELERHIEWFKSLPNEMTLYRIIHADDESEIDLKQPGAHYSDNKRELIYNHTHAAGHGEFKYLITVKANKSLFDAQETISNNILYPNEMEISLRNKGKGVKVISVDKL
jgi:hypothetical protein